MFPVASVLAVPLSICLLSAPPATPASGAGPTELATANPTRLASYAAADTSSEDKKERVPKSRTDTRDREGGTSESGGQEAHEESESGGGFFDRCFTDIFLGLLGLNSDGPKVEVVRPVVEEPRQSLAFEETWTAGLLAMALPADSTAQGVMVWNRAGGEDAGADVISHLAPGTDVVVRDSDRLPSGQWIEVGIGDAAEPAGWVSAGDLVHRRTQELPQPAGAEAGAAGPSGPPLPVEISVDLAAFRSGPDDVWNEYAEKPWRLGLRVAWPSRSMWRVGFAAGYSQIRGNPKFDYRTAGQVDYPFDSQLEIVDVSVDGGQSLRLGRTWSLGWAVGPTLNWVQERARVRSEVLEGGLWNPAGTRDEILARWRVGGDALVFVEHRTDDFIRIGLELRAFVIPWHSEGVRSLTLDFIEDRSIAGGSVGIYLGI